MQLLDIIKHVRSLDEIISTTISPSPCLPLAHSLSLGYLLCGEDGDIIEMLEQGDGQMPVQLGDEFLFTISITSP
jgi:hypothetical protein